jgi:hypothetical protein
MEQWIRNFICSGDISKKKLVTVAWRKVCTPFNEGGLGVKSLVCLNEAFNLNLCWTLLNSDESWARLLRSRVLRKDVTIRHHIFSTLWSSAKNEFLVLKENSCRLVGDGQNIQLWTDEWCGFPLIHTLNI